MAIAMVYKDPARSRYCLFATSGLYNCSKEIAYASSSLSCINLSFVDEMVSASLFTTPTIELKVVCSISRLLELLETVESSIVVSVSASRKGLVLSLPVDSLRDSEAIGAQSENGSIDEAILSAIVSVAAGAESGSGLTGKAALVCFISGAGVAGNGICSGAISSGLIGSVPGVFRCLRRGVRGDGRCPKGALKSSRGVTTLSLRSATQTGRGVLSANWARPLRMLDTLLFLPV